MEHQRVCVQTSHVAVGTVDGDSHRPQEAEVGNDTSAWGRYQGESETAKHISGGNRSGENRCVYQCVGWVTAPVGTTIVVELPDGLVKTNVPPIVGS